MDSPSGEPFPFVDTVSLVLVRVMPPGYRTDLWLFLHNSGLTSLAREGKDGLRVLHKVNSRERLEEALGLWEARNPGASAKIIDGA